MFLCAFSIVSIMPSERDKLTWKAKCVLVIETYYRRILQNIFSTSNPDSVNFYMLCYFYLHLCEGCLKLFHVRYSGQL
jgi:hypothetical protein